MITHVGDVFLSISGQKYAEIGIELGLANVLDNFSFSFVFSIKNKGVIAVIPKIAVMTSRDRKCVGGARKWRHAVRILLAIILVFT